MRSPVDVGAARPLRPLDSRSLRRAVRTLAARDPDLAAAVARLGPPPLWARRPGFATLVRIILEQQVSLASAAATYRRLRAAAGRVTPARVAFAGEASLRAAGVTRQKAVYCCALAREVTSGRLALAALGHLPETAVRSRLLQLPGVGPWTADIYLLMALRRPDVWPRGDLALARAAQHVKRLRRLPDDDALSGMAERWAPWRAAAARILWHAYLCQRRQSDGGLRPASRAGRPAPAPAGRRRRQEASRRATPGCRTRGIPS